MPKPEEDLIDRLTTRPEVREKARALLRAVHSKTGPGTGYDIGEAKSGLPAICAYSASKRYAYLLTRSFSFVDLIAWNVMLYQCWLCGHNPRSRAEGVLPCAQNVC
jgi:hypothetical protein